MLCKIREWKTSDAADLATALSNKKVQDNLRDGLPFPYKEDDGLDFINAMLSADKNDTFSFAITVDDKVIGSIGVFRQENIHRLTAELGYYIAEEYWGKGIMTEAVKQICEFVFKNSDIIRIYAEPFAYNTASCRVLEKAGFRFEGLLKHNAIKNNTNVFDIYQKNDDKKSTQLVFCDFSTPKNDGSFNLYDDIRDKLIAKGVPKEEIAFIHEADSEAKKKELFSKVRQGKVRVLLGSTAKCGAGTNIQDKLIALHHLDCPWRPSDLEQREGRIIRQGNENKEVEVYRYMTEATFDAYLYQTIENKQRFISQIMSSKSPVRSCEDVDEATLSYAEVKALCAGNPLIKEKMDLDVAVTKLKVSKANHTSQQYNIEDSVRKHFPERIAKTEQRIEGYKSDLAHVKAQPIVTEGIAPMTVLNKTFTDKEEAGKAILLACKQVKSKESLEIGTYKGFDMSLSYDSFAQEFHLELQREMSYTVTLGTSESGNILRIDNALDSIEKRLENSQEQLETLNEQLSTAKAELGKPFPQEAELTEKLARLAELNTLLNIDDNAIENASMAAEKKPDIPISADETKPMRNVSADKKPSILGRIREMQSNQTGNIPKEKTPTKDKTSEIS